MLNYKHTSRSLVDRYFSADDVTSSCDVKRSRLWSRYVRSQHILVLLIFWTSVNSSCERCLVQFSSGPWSPQWAEGICWGASGTKWQRCMAWHSWDTWNSQDHQLVRRIMSSCDWTPPCCLVARHPDRQNCRCDWHHQPSLLLEFGDDHVF